jgi:amidohydrolase
MSTNLLWSHTLRPEVIDRWDELIQLRREFHRYPEVSLHEYQTAQRIRAWLTAHGIANVQPVADTGVVALIRGGHAGPTLLYRADIDGLPIQEDSGVAFASEHPGVMHSCGHDGHIAIALLLASTLNRRRESLRGSVKVVFQPAEEIGAGATAMMGLFARPLETVHSAKPGVIGLNAKQRIPH